jgi:hypothetical protein
MRAILLLAVLSSSVRAQVGLDESGRPWAAGVSRERQANALRIFKEGNTLFEESQHAAALGKYRQAVALWDHPAIRYNMAVALIHLDQPLEAFHELERALKFGAAPLGSESWAQALTYKKLLLGQLAELKIVCDEKGAEVSLDGERLFEAPGQETRLVRPGAHQVVAAKAGFLTASVPLLLIPGRNPVEVLKLTPIGSLTTRRRWPVWQPWTVAAAGVAGAALLGIPLILSAKSNYDSYDSNVARLCTQMICHTSDLPGNVRDLKSKGDAEYGASIAGFVIGGAVAASGIVLVILNQPRVVEKAKVSFAPLLAPGTAGASVGVRF